MNLLIHEEGVLVYQSPMTGELKEKLTVGKFTIGDRISIAERMYSELFFYRSAMNREAYSAGESRVI